MKYNLIKLSDAYDREKDDTPSDTILGYMSGVRKLDGVDVKQCIILRSGACQLGWDSYCFLTQNCNCFKIYDGDCLYSNFEKFNLNSQKTMHIVTRELAVALLLLLNMGTIFALCT